MKKRILLLTSMLLLAAVAAFFFWHPGRKETRIGLITVRPQYGYIARSVTATGNIQPVDTVIVGAQVSGVVKFVYADFNNAVRQGQLLAKVDPSIISAQIDQAKASVATARSNLQYQQTNFNRQQQLFDLGAISKADYQVAVNQFSNARASLDNATAQLRLFQRNLYYTNIYSPIDGIVLNRNISAGQTIASSFNAPTLFVIARDLSKVQVTAAVDEADIGQVASGQHVSFTVDAFPDDIFVGTVQKIYLHPSVSANVVTYPVIINIDNNDLKLKPGMTASTTIYVQEDSNALLIPARAISFRPDTALYKAYVIKPERMHQQGNARTGEGGPSTVPPSGGLSSQKPAGKAYHVWVKRGDTLSEKKILTGLSDDNGVEVVKGLGTGDEVVTSLMTGQKNTGGQAQRSPFMPQMRRGPSGGQRPSRNQ